VYYFTDNQTHSALHVYYIIVRIQISIILLYSEQTEIIDFDVRTDTKCIPPQNTMGLKNSNELHLKLNMFN